MSDRKRAIQLLRTDLHNSPLHFFGIHSQCCTNYCKVAQANTSSSSSVQTSDTSSQAMSHHNLSPQPLFNKKFSVTK